MILTQEIIDSTITKLNYMIAKKVVKYACNIAIGKKLNCLLKEIKLLKLYKQILCNFEIVGEPHSCSCEIPGEYAFDEIEINDSGESKIQFLKDGTGTLVNPAGTFAIEWGYQEGLLMIKLPNDVIITYNTVTFDTECNIEFEDQDNGYSFLATIDAPTDALVYDGYYGVMQVIKPNGSTILRTLNYIPVDSGGDLLQNTILDSYITNDEIADSWVTNFSTSNFQIQYSSTSEVFNMFTTYYNDYDYTDHIFRYIYCITQPTATVSITEAAMFGGGSLTQSFIVDGNIIYTHNGVYADYAALVAGFNSNVTDYVMSYTSGTNITITTSNAVEGTIFGIDYYNPIYEDDEGSFTAPGFTTLNGTFNPSSLESSFYTNQNPCDTSDNEQICLSNEQVIKIINYINKLNKK